MAALAGAMAAHSPGYRLHAGSWAGEADLGAGSGGAAYTWLLDGRAEA